jgi:hypothetical protein
MSRTTNDSNTSIVPICVTLKGCPATISVALRAGPLFAVTVNVTDPDPLPPPGGVMVIQSTGLDADQGQPPLVVTAIVPEPPATSNI